MKKTVFNLAATALLLASVSCNNETCQPSETDMALIPVPQEMKLASECFTLTSKISIALDESNEQLKGIADYFNEKTAPATGFKLPLSAEGKIEFRLVEDAALEEEGYHLEADRDHILISANQPAGIFYGVQTLLQMLPPEIKSTTQQPKDTKWTIPCAEIIDKPQFRWRGLMLDVCRHWFTKEEVMKFIDELAEYKMNVFHWHLITIVNQLHHPGDVIKSQL